MSYGNNYNRSPKRGFYNDQYNGPYRPQYGPQPQYQQRHQTPPKKSGATYTEIRKGNFVGGVIVNAWNKSRGKGLITATVAPYHKSDELVKSAAGKEYMKMIATVKYLKTGNEKLIPCLMNTQSKVIVLRDLGMVITPNGSGHTSSGK